MTKIVYRTALEPSRGFSSRLSALGRPDKDRIVPPKAQKHLVTIVLDSTCRKTRIPFQWSALANGFTGAERRLLVHKGQLWVVDGAGTENELSGLQLMKRIMAAAKLYRARPNSSLMSAKSAWVPNLSRRTIDRMR